MRLAVFTLIAATIFPTLDASAQACQGLPSFSTGPVQLSGNAGWANDGEAFGVGMAAGSATAFGGLTFGAITYDAFEGSTTLVGAGAGYQVPVNASGSIQLCPTVSGALGFGPNDVNDSGVDVLLRTVSFGLSIGSVFGDNAQLRVNPSASIAVFYSSSKFESGTAEETVSDTYGWIDLGAGVIVSKMLSIRPAFGFPVGLRGGDPTVSLTVAVNFGSR